MKPVTCRACGAEGFEQPGDPAPGICPECLDTRMAAATEWLKQRADEIAPEALIAEARRYLVQTVGLTPAYARDFLRRVLAAQEDA